MARHGVAAFLLCSVALLLTLPSALAGGPRRLPALAAVLALLALTLLPAPGQAQTQTTLWTAELTVGTFTLYSEDAFGCNADLASDCAALLSEDEFSYDNTTHKIVLLSSQGEYFDIEFAQAPGEASASFILIGGRHVPRLLRGHGR